MALCSVDSNTTVKNSPPATRNIHSAKVFHDAEDLSLFLCFERRKFRQPTKQAAIIIISRLSAQTSMPYSACGPNEIVLGALATEKKLLFSSKHNVRLCSGLNNQDIESLAWLVSW